MNDENVRFTVNEVSKLTGLTPYTIRFYAKEGLIPNIKRNEHGVRFFSNKELHWFYLIEHFKKADMTIKEIKQFIDWCIEGETTIASRADFFKEKRQQVESKVLALQKTLDFIKYKEWEYGKAKEAGTTDIIASIPEDMMTEELKKIRDIIEVEREYREVK